VLSRGVSGNIVFLRQRQSSILVCQPKTKPGENPIICQADYLAKPRRPKKV
jgi:hypothetical protein